MASLLDRITFSKIMAGQPTLPDQVPPPRNSKALCSGLMKTVWFPLVRPYF